MRTVLSSNRLCNVLASTCFTIAAVLSLFFATGGMSASSHAQSLPQTNAQEQTGDTIVLDARDMPARTLFIQAVSIELEFPEKAISKYDEVMQRFGRATTPGSRLFAARALLNKGGILGKQGNDKEAILAYERIERNFGNEKNPSIREVLASALVSKAETFYRLGSTEKALATYAQLDEQFSPNGNDFIKRLIDITKWRATEIRASNKITLSSMP